MTIDRLDNVILGGIISRWFKDKTWKISLNYDK